MMRKKIRLTAVLGMMVLMMVSCDLPIHPNNIIGEDKKIDIKGSLMNGDMKSSNLEAGFWGKTVYVYFHDYLGECVVSVSNRQDEVVLADTLLTDPEASSRFFMGDLPHDRYHLVISNGIKEAEGWFYNFRLSASKP